MTPAPLAQIISGAVDGCCGCMVDQEARVAQQIVLALDAADYVIVPRQPTVAMMAAAQDAWLKDPLKLTSTMYRAMIGAAASAKAFGNGMPNSNPCGRA